MNNTGIHQLDPHDPKSGIRKLRVKKSDLRVPEASKKINRTKAYGNG
jgi:hypothetical protein